MSNLPGGLSGYSFSSAVQPESRFGGYSFTQAAELVEESPHFGAHEDPHDPKFTDEPRTKLPSDLPQRYASIYAPIQETQNASFLNYKRYSLQDPQQLASTPLYPHPMLKKDLLGYGEGPGGRNPQK